MNPFDYLKAINETKKDIMVDDIAEKEYNPFIINRGLSVLMNELSVIIKERTFSTLVDAEIYVRNESV